MTALLPLAALLAAMLSVQSGAALAKTLFAAVGPAGTTSLRLTIAALILAAVFRPWRRRYGPEALRAVALYGAALGGMNLVFYFALARLPLGLAVAIEFLGPLTVAVSGSRRPIDLLWASLAAIGVATVLPWSGGTSAPDPVGIAFALGAGACWGLYIVFGRKAGIAAGTGPAISIGMGVAAAVGAPLGLARSGAALFAPGVLAQACAVAVLSSAVPYSLEMTALERLPAHTFGILMSLEPALAALIGLVLLGERLNARQLAAIVCIVAASLGSSAAAGPGPAPEAPPPAGGS